MDTPAIALFIFKRPEQTRRVFEVIRQAQPGRLFVIADGPRNAQERALCDETRAVVEQVDWPCEVVTNFASANLGLRQRLVSGITWVFEQTEEAIFLEDDCLPHPTFFRFCAELLERYRNQEAVMHISGDCFADMPEPCPSYYFTRYAHVWGWATWRRAWKLYDASLSNWDNHNIRAKVLRKCQTRAERRFWDKALDAAQRGDIETWAYQWAFTLMATDGMAINPTINLVQNIGFGNSATNTMDADSDLAKSQINEMLFPLRHPETISVNAGMDKATAELFFKHESSLREAMKAAYHRLRR